MVILPQFETMKKILFTAVLLAGCLTFQFTNAQLRISLGVNIGSQPDWGPTGYDHAEYYYLPDIDAYYSVPTHEYVYFDNNSWIHAAYLPQRYSNYDLYNGYKVVVNERNPWLRAPYYRSHYANYRGRHDQHLIRDSRDARYQNHWHDNRGGQGHGGNYGNGGQGYGNRGNGGQDYHGNHGNYNHGNRGGQPTDHGNGYGDNRGHNNGQGHGDDHNHGHGRPQ